MSHPAKGPRVIVALDLPDAPSARAMVQRLTPSLCRVKVGKELFTAAGPGIVTRVRDAGCDVFLDLKLYDIPNTVRGAAGAAILNAELMHAEGLLEAR